ncbi:Receptor-type tyrosine-protein phosphatase F [Liparis tanakae]|uniref:Receptor-type tyrosine-protein phosphatase F n=1 Tax=Liparis tanakae TaxID=230148 RepID=A0A4Z2JFI7_9TELE|nr:Receptor-type tyrosine-protein phosphatase F [Liparis tanakae]
MGPHRHRAVPLLPRAAVTFLLLLGCTVFSSQADSVPSFVKTPEDQTGISGGVASFVCQATGEPKPRITWMKKGKKRNGVIAPVVELLYTTVIEFDDGSGSVLRIQPLRTHRDEAIYECTGTNSDGEVTTSAKLTVLEGRSSPAGRLRPFVAITQALKQSPSLPIPRLNPIFPPLSVHADLMMSSAGLA